MSKILILTLTEQRDKPVDERLAQCLRDMGHEVMVRNFVLAGSDAVTVEKPDAVVLPMIGSDHKLNFARQIKEWGVVTIVRRGEAGAGRVALEQMDEDRQRVVVGDYDYAEHIDLELVWGQEFADILAERGRMEARKLVACGPFTLDVCTQYERQARPGKRRVLFATAFSAADDHPDYTECGLPEGNPLQRRLYARHAELRALWIATIKNLVATKSHKYDFALKVRPGESTRAYQEAFGKTVQILPYDYPSGQAIAASDVVVHAGSTMAIEAHLLGVPSLNFANCNPDPILANACPQVNDYGELSEALGRLVWGRSNIDTDKLTWLEDHLYGPLDGSACHRAAEAISRVLRKGRKKPQIPDQWPREPRYQRQDTTAEPGPDHVRMICPSCKNMFGLHHESQWGVCPFCALTVRKIIAQEAAVA